MSGIYEEFAQELADCRVRYAGSPRRELVHLFLTALEREQLVAVGYRDARIRSRLAGMPLDDEVRDLIAHALLWAWKDEEMHAIYVRGILLKLGSVARRFQVFATQAAGAVGGWSAAVRQHARWGQAPVSRFLATAATWAGMAAGKVPREVAGHLDYGPFREFCLFNVEAERTAWLCWHRLAELAAADPDLPAELVQDFQRIETDEANHQRIFEMLADVLGEDDRLRPPHTAESLAQGIGAVGPFFLPRRRRDAAAQGSALGSGGPVWVLEGSALGEKDALFRRVLEESDLRGQVEARAKELGKRVSDLRVAVKPTFMLGYHRKDPSPVTSPALVAALARLLREAGCAEVAVVEGPNIYDRFYGRRTVREVAEYLGIADPSFRLVDASAEQVPHAYRRGMAQYTVSRTWRDADFRISFPKMRSHPIEQALLAVGNLEWLAGRIDQFLFAERQAHRETAIMTLIGDFPPHFALLDAFDQVPDGLLGVMGCPRPRAPLRFYAGADALAVDLVAARHLGIEPGDSGLLRAACHWFGDPAPSIDVRGTDEPVRGWRGPYRNEMSALLSLLARPVYVFGSGRGALFVPEMDEEAFPPLAAEGLWLGLGRSTLRALLGLRHPA